MAELARLIGQTDSLGNLGKGGSAQQPVPRHEPHQQDYYSEDDYRQPEPEPPPVPAGPPAWMQRANIRRDMPREAPRVVARDNPRALPPEPEPERDDYRSAVHPLHRYAQQPQVAPPQPDDYYDEQPAHQHQAYHQQAYQHDPQAYVEAEQETDASRYDDALYGQIENGAQDFQRDPAYPDDPYAYQGEYDEELDEPQKRRGLPLKVAAVLALGVFGVAAAYGYHSYVGSTRSSEIPIIKADNSPTKIVPQQSDSGAKVPDRMVTGDGTEKMVSREEQPVDVNSRNVGPRVVFPPLNQNANPPPVASVAPTAMPAAPPPGSAGAAPGGTLPNGEPRKIKTFSVKGDQPDPSALPVNAQPQAAPPATAAKNAKAARTPPSQANASANGPLSLSPQGQPVETGTQIAATNPAQVVPSAPASGSGGYLIQVSSQRSEADAQSSFRALQSKFPTVLGSQTPVIRRADLGEKGTVYRAMVGPFGSQEEADQFCNNYRSAGGQCLRVKN
ncbi:SPOR domain-containing protein [Bradyrhizobium sp. Tv2a-2]|uniref:SPOR domain-containing protein n=1 Tax=Bradyrhizobium sp. Tv2a-2 TaxID=113395 RepID=UPI0032E0161E